MRRITEIVGSRLSAGVSEIIPISGGVTENFTTRVVLDNGRTVIIKIGGNIGREIRGYKLLNTSSLKEYLPEVIDSGDDYLILGNIDAVITLKTAVETHKDSAEEIRELFCQILTVKFSAWEESFGDDHCRDRTMIREEFPETREMLTSFFNSEASAPVKIAGEDMIYPSINSMLEKIGALLDQENSQGITLIHGDLKPENILVNRENGLVPGKFWFVDPEWACHGDWVEALSRMGKWRSSKYASVDNSSYRLNNGYLEISYTSTFPSICQLLEKEAIDQGEIFAKKIDDKSWKKRYYLYLATSLLREVVLLEKRALPMNMSTLILGEALKYFALLST